MSPHPPKLLSTPSPLHLLLLPLLLLSLLIPLASARPSFRQETDICPGVVDCLVPNVEPLVSLEQRERGHATGTLNLSACISFCQDTKHKYFHFLAGPPGKKGPCACFNGCAFLRSGDSTVGLADLCKASPLLQLKAQKLQEIEEWGEDDAETAYLSGHALQKQKQQVNGGLMTQGQMFLKQANEEEQLAKELVQRQKLAEKETQPPEDLLKLQQNKQLASQKAVGWRMLQQYQVLLTTIQQKFLEKQQEELKVQKEQREEEILLTKERLSAEKQSKHMKEEEEAKQLRRVMTMFKNLVEKPTEGKRRKM